MTAGTPRHEHDPTRPRLHSCDCGEEWDADGWGECAGCIQDNLCPGCGLIKCAHCGATYCRPCWMSFREHESWTCDGCRRTQRETRAKQMATPTKPDRETYEQGQPKPGRHTVWPTRRACQDLGAAAYKVAPTINATVEIAASRIRRATRALAYTRAQWEVLWLALGGTRFSCQHPLAPQLVLHLKQWEAPDKRQGTAAETLAMMHDAPDSLGAEDSAWAITVAMDVRRRYGDKITPGAKWWSIEWREANCLQAQEQPEDE